MNVILGVLVITLGGIGLALFGLARFGLLKYALVIAAGGAH